MAGNLSFFCFQLKFSLFLLSGTEITDELLLQLIGDGNDSEIEEVEDDEGDREESVLPLVPAEEPESPPRPGLSSATAPKARQK